MYWMILELGDKGSMVKATAIRQQQKEENAMTPNVMNTVHAAYAACDFNLNHCT
jgi:hypothetical protein